MDPPEKDRLNLSHFLNQKEWSRLSDIHDRRLACLSDKQTDRKLRATTEKSSRASLELKACSIASSTYIRMIHYE